MLHYTNTNERSTVRVDAKRDDEKMNRVLAWEQGEYLFLNVGGWVKVMKHLGTERKKKIGKHLEETEQNNKMVYLNEYLPPKYKLFFKMWSKLFS